MAHAFGVAGDVEQRLGQIEAVDPWPALGRLEIGTGFGRGKQQIGATVALAVFGLLARLRVLQRDHFGHPGGG
ncbi:hypothetical protein D3C84_1129990 [compost metagenome]